MRFVALLFLLVAFGFVKGLILAEVASEDLDFPDLSPRQIGDCDTSPENETAVNATGCIRVYDLPDCSSITSCTKFVGLVIYNIGAYLVWIVLFVVDMVIFVAALLILMVSLLFEPIPGAPGFVSLFINAVLPAMLAIKLYRLIRDGSDE
jgi:hypothetical protein